MSALGQITINQSIIYLSIYVSICTCLSIYTYVLHSILLYRSIHLYNPQLSISYINLYTSLSIYRHLYLSIYRSMDLFIYQSVIYLSIYVSRCKRKILGRNSKISISSFHDIHSAKGTIYIYIYQSIYVSIYLTICLSIYSSILQVSPWPSLSAHHPNTRLIQLKRRSA